MDEKPGTGSPFDWREAYARLERAGRTLASGGERPAEEVARILQERAKKLARPVEERAPAGETFEAVMFSLAGDRYGIETVHAREVLRLRGMMPLPCVPAFVAGVIHQRGRLLPVLDLRRVIGLPGGELGGEGLAIVVEARGMSFALLAESVEGAVRLALEEIAPAPSGGGAERPAFVRGLTQDMAAILDLDAMARDPRIVVKDEAG